MKQLLPISAKFYLGILLASSAILTYHLTLYIDWLEVNWFAVILFLTLTILSDSFPVKMANGVVVSVSFAITFSSILLFDPLLVIIINVIGDLLSLRKGRDAAKFLFNASQLTLTSGVAAISFNAFYSSNSGFSIQYIIAALIALAICFLLNSIFITLIISLTQKEKPYAIWLTNIKWLAPSFLGMAPLGIIFALIYIYVGFWGLIMFLLPLSIARHSFVSYINMRDTFLDTIQSLSVAIDAKDRYTKGHSTRVAAYAVSLAREMKWREDKIENFRHIALIHDVGKIAIPESILKKEGNLTKEEYSQMKCHAAAGSELIKDIKFFADSSNIIKHHHERWDGTGYPEGLKGEQIPVGARILFIADAFDAMTSDRPYRKALSPLNALQEIREGAGTQFDPRAVEAFVRIFPKIKFNEKQHSDQAFYGELAAANKKMD